jgi:hypothetical protein
MAPNDFCFPLARIAYAADYTEKIQPNYRLLVIELLEDAQE